MATILSPFSVLNCITYAALVFHIYEWVYDMPFEFCYIWRKPGSYIVKWQYLLSRYTGLIIQIVSCIVRARLDPRLPSIVFSCRRLFVFKAVGISLLILFLNISLVHRLIALYNRGRLSAAIFIAILAIQFAHDVALGALLALDFGIDGICMIASVPKTSGALSILPMVVQSTLWGLTIFKSLEVRAPLLSLVVRDGTWVFGAMLVLLACSSVSLYKDLFLINFAYIIAPCIVTSANCHIIKNMEVNGEEASKVESFYGVTGVAEFSTFMLETNNATDT